jgi:hypothetical protein
MVCHCGINSPCRPAAWNVKYGAGRAFAVGVGGIGTLDLAAVIGAALERARHPRFDWVIARFEGQHQDRHTAVCSAGIERLLRVEDTAIRRK